MKNLRQCGNTNSAAYNAIHWMFEARKFVPADSISLWNTRKKNRI